VARIEQTEKRENRENSRQKQKTHGLLAFRLHSQCPICPWNHDEFALPQEVLPTHEIGRFVKKAALDFPILLFRA